MHENKECLELKCSNCGCISHGKIEIKTDVEKKEKWNKEHAERIELQAKQEIILEEFNRIANEHNSIWYTFHKWHVLPRPFGDYLDIVDFHTDGPIKSAPYDSGVMNVWLDCIYDKPQFDYIECQVCKCRKYIDRC